MGQTAPLPKLQPGGGGGGFLFIKKTSLNKVLYLVSLYLIHEIWGFQTKCRFFKGKECTIFNLPENGYIFCHLLPPYTSPYIPSTSLYLPRIFPCILPHYQTPLVLDHIHLRLPRTWWTWHSQNNGSTSSSLNADLPRQPSWKRATHRCVRGGCKGGGG